MTKTKENPPASSSAGARESKAGRAEAAEHKGGYWETVKTVVYAVLIALVVRTFLIEPFNIPSGSMIPTLLVGDYLFVSKFSYGYSRFSFPFSPPLFSGRIFGSQPRRGDVVVFKLPRDNETDYIKRVIGLPGDRIQVREGILYINDKPVKRRRIGSYSEAPGGSRYARYLETLPGGRVHQIIEERDDSPFSDNTRVYTVPAGHYFLMGDNRDNSQDSRFGTVGYVPAENLVGRAEFLFFSIDEDATRWWEVWNWFTAIRYDRIFQSIE